MNARVFRCVGHVSAASVVAVGAAGQRTLADLHADIDRLDRTLSVQAGDNVIVACADRYRTAVALLALWRRRCVAVLPSSVQAAALESLANEHRASHVLHDADVAELPEDDAVSLPGSSALRDVGVCDGDQVLVCLSTSGSTGAPVNVLKTATQLLGEVDVLVDALGERPAAVLSTVPPRHIYGLLFGVLWPLRLGVPFVRDTPLLPEAIVDHARRTKADVLIAVPAHLAGLDRAGDVKPLSRVVSSGAALPVNTWSMLRAQLGMHVTEVLGSTETGGIAQRHESDALFVPFDGVRVGVDTEGQMLLWSERLPAEEAQPYRADDHVEVLGDGTFRHSGRSGGVVKVGGTRVSLAQIEERARCLHGVHDAAALSVEVGSTRGNEVWLAVAAGLDWDAARLRKELAPWFEAVVLPRRYRVLETLPRDAAGKLSHQLLRALFDDARDDTRDDLTDMNTNATTELTVLEREVSETHANVRLHVPTNLLYFRGHFDGHPILPGVVQLQCIVVEQAQQAWRDLGMAVGARRLKFTRPILPGEELRVQLSRVRSDRVDFTLSVAGENCASGSLMFETASPAQDADT